MFKLYILNGEEAFFGLYPILRHQVMLPGGPQIITSTRYLLLDFDGPICDIYAGLPDHAVADRLRTLFTRQGIGHLLKPDGGQFRRRPES